MDGLEDKLNSILSDPDAMGRIAEMAKSLMGREPDGAPAEPEPDPTLLKRAAALIRRDALRPDESAVLAALRPFLSLERQRRLDRALRIARLAALASVAGEFVGLGGEGDV